MGFLSIILRFLFQEILKQLSVSLVKWLVEKLKKKSTPFSTKIRGWISKTLGNRPKS